MLFIRWNGMTNIIAENLAIYWMEWHDKHNGWPQMLLFIGWNCMTNIIAENVAIHWRE